MTLKEWFVAYCLQFGVAQLYNEWTPEEEKFLSDVARTRKKGESHLNIIYKFRDIYIEQCVETDTPPVDNTESRIRYRHARAMRGL